MKSFIVTCVLVIISVQYSEAEYCGKSPVKVRPDDCCALPKSADEDGIIKDCIAKYGEHSRRVNADYSGVGPIRGTCISECIMNGTGTRDLSPAKLEERANKLIAEKPEWAGVPEIILTECTRAYVAKLPLLDAGNNLAPLKPDDPHCHPKYTFRFMCRIKTFLNHCPVQHRTNSDDCNKLFDFYKSCDL